MKKLLPFVLGRSLNFLSWLAPGVAAKLGFRLFCYPFRGTLKGFHYTFLETAEQSKFSHQGVDIKVYKWQNGPRKILFLHGWQSHSFRWKNYVENFPDKEYTLYALDAPGHGLSGGKFLTVPLYSEIVEKFIQNQGEFDAIISHSLGSFTSLYTFFRLPLLPVKKLVVLASPGEAEEFISFYQSSLNLSKRTIRLIRAHFEDVIGEPIEYFSAKAFAEHMNRPGLIIHDEEDDETPFRHSVHIHKSWPKSRLLLTKGLSHNLKSPIVIKEVLEFVLNDTMNSKLVNADDSAEVSESAGGM